MIKVPAGLPLRDAVSAYSLGLTAHYLAHDTGKLKPGMSCLVHAAAGGVGHLLVQLAKKAGASVVATVGSKEKADFVQIARRRQDHPLSRHAVPAGGQDLG